MASKKFSRLSIMLEARDKMTRPMQNAARASQRLHKNVNTLSETFDKSRNSTVNASVSQRVLSERYRELGQRIGGTNEKVKLSTKMFRSLPAPIRLAAYTIEGYSKALYNAVTKNKLATITTKVLTTSFKTMYNTTMNLAYYLGKATKALWNFSRAGKLVSAMTKPFKLAANGAKKFSLNVLKAVKNTFMFKASAVILNDIKEATKLNAQATKNWVKEQRYLVKNTRVYQGLSLAIKGVQRNLQKGALAFDLWKNSSRTVERVSNHMTGLKNKAKSLLNPIMQNIRGFQQMGNNATRAGQRGRASFNQLADANAKLNKQLERMNRQLTRSNKKLGSMRTSMGSLNNMGAAFGTAYAAQAAYGTGEQVASATVGKSMEQQYSAASIGILVGDEQKAADYYKQITSYAATTADSTEDWAYALRGAVRKSDTVDDLKVYQKTMEQLALMDPMQGLEGAALAVRELNSGDTMSLVERFELPRKQVNAIKDIEDPIKQTAALSKIIGDEFGYTADAVDQMKELPLMQWKKATNILATGLGYIGEGALESITPLLEKFNELWDTGKMDPFIAKMSSGLKSLVDKGIAFATNFGSNVESIKSKWQPALDLIKNIRDTIVEAWPTITEIMSNARSIFNNVAGEINSLWPTVNTVIQTALGLVKDFSNWVVNNWPVIMPIITGVVTAMAALKVANIIAAGFAILKNVMALWRAGTLLATTAQWALNTALLANPIGLVIAAVIGLAAGLIIAYKKSETFRTAIQNALGWLKEKGIQALNLGKTAVDGIKDAFKSATTWVGNLWDKFMGFVDKVKNTKLNWKGILPGGDSFVQVGGSKGHRQGLNHVPYDGYSARLHKGERVLTAEENKAYNRGMGGGGVSVTGNTFIVRQDSDIDAIAEALYDRMNQAQTAMGGTG